MSTVNYQELEDAIHWAKPYTHGSSHATGAYNDAGVYVYMIWSYNTLMLTLKGGDVSYFNYAHYSSTTSRLQNIIRKHWDVTDRSVTEVAS